MTAPDRDRISSEYILPCNDQVGDPSLVQNDSRRFHASADRIDIDIPLVTLSRQTVDTAASLDRQIAANLRIRNILEEYLAVKNRTRLVLKDLGIPYLDSDHKGAGRKNEEEIRNRKRLEKEVENISLYSIGYASTDRDPKKAADPVVQMEPRLKKNAYPLASDGPDAVGFNESGDRGNVFVQPGAGSYSSELPWIFRIILGTVRTVYANKLEILLWSGVLVIVATLIALVVRK